MRYFCTCLIYTLKCNFQCSMCGLSCSPKQQEKMSLDEAKKYVTQSISNNLFFFGITGGEPLLYETEINELIKFAVKKGAKKISLTTNCYWAKNYKNTYDIMNRLKNSGLNHMKISCDKFHMKMVPLEYIKNVLNVSEEIKLRVTLGCTVEKSEESVFVLLKGLGASVLGHSITFNGIQEVGRAKNYLANKETICKVVKNSCPEGGILTITPNGNIYACGSLYPLDSDRNCGNLKHENLNVILNRLQENKDLQYIMEHGIEDYYECISQKYPEIRFSNACHICEYIFKGMNHEERMKCRSLMNKR